MQLGGIHLPVPIDLGKGVYPEAGNCLSLLTSTHAQREFQRPEKDPEGEEIQLKLSWLYCNDQRV